MREYQRRHDRGRQPLTTPAEPFRKSEERTENPHPRANRTPRVLRYANLLGQQFIHLGDGQRLEPETSFFDLRQEPMNRPATILNRLWRCPQFSQLVVGELGNLLGVRPLNGGG